MRPDFVTPGLSEVMHHLGECRDNCEYDQLFPIISGPADLYLVVDGRFLLPVEVVGMRRSFVVPPHSSIHIVSRHGTRVTKIEVITNEEYLVFPEDHPMLLSGWASAEIGGDRFWPPITGDARFPGAPEAAAYQVIVWVA